MKIAKLSLVAAVAVAGFTTANAQPLEEAIKNVDVTGSVVYRYNDIKNDGHKLNSATYNDIAENSTNNNNYKVALGLSSKVNDDVKFNSRFVVGQPSNTGTGDAGFASLDSSKDGDQNVGTELTNANFAYTGIKNTTVTVGKQGLTTPWTVAVDSDNNEQTGTGILALTTVGSVTFAGAYFNQTNLKNSSDAMIDGVDVERNANGTPKLTDGKQTFTAGTSAKALFTDGGEDIATLGAITTLGPVTLDAWYLDAQDIFDTYTVGAKAATELSGVKLTGDARYVSLEADKALNPDGDKNTIAKVAVTADAGLVDGKLAYAKTGKDGGLTALDNDATTTLLGWNMTANGKADADYVQAVLGFDILSNLNLSANYGNLEYTPDDNVTAEEEEVYAQLLYKMSKNLSTYVRYGTYTKEVSEATQGTANINDDVRGRLQVEYTF